MSERPKGHGGRRPGAGRKPKAQAPTVLNETELMHLMSMPAPDEIESIAAPHAWNALAALVRVVSAGTNEAARVTAATAIIDRGYGKPAVDIGGDGALPLMMPEPTIFPSVSGTIRSEARKHARLAIDVLRRIADFGQSQAASTSAARALLDRGLGTVAIARLPDEIREEPLGKKEQRQRTAAVAATGKYATRPLPKGSKEDGRG